MEEYIKAIQEWLRLQDESNRHRTEAMNDMLKLIEQLSKRIDELERRQ